MNTLPFMRRLAPCAAVLALLWISGCSALLPKAARQPSFYSLDAGSAEPRAATALPSASLNATPTLIVNAPRAAAGFDSQRIVYVRQAQQLEYFAHSQWVDTPARMLGPLIVAAVDSGGAFRAVVLTPSAAAGDIRLDTEIVRLQQNFGGQPSRVRFTLRAYLVDNATRRVLAWREFDDAVAAASEDPHGGVVAAHRAVQTVLKQLTVLCGEAASLWQAAAAEAPKRTNTSQTLP